MMALKIFIDTEFTNLEKGDLISIGLVSEDGNEFYAEVPFEESQCSDFVKNEVLPLLVGPPYFLSIRELQERLGTWLSILESPTGDFEICFDYDDDWNFFCQVVGEKILMCCVPRRVTRNINKLLRYEYHKITSLPEHHALNDAKAMQYAFRERTNL